MHLHVHPLLVPQRITLEGKLFPALVTLPFPGKTLNLPVYRPHVPHQVALGAELFAALVAGLAPLCLEMHAIFVFLEVFLAEE